MNINFGIAKLRVKQAHLQQWIETMVKYGGRWNSVIFSDEKKFNLDGLESYQYYWRYLKIEKNSILFVIVGGSSVMACDAMAACGLSELAIFGKQKIFQKAYLYFIGVPTAFRSSELWHRLHFSARQPKKLLTSGLQIMDRPACSPDLNPIENVWGILFHAVYRGERQFESTSKLSTGIILQWKKIEISTAKKLVDTMKKRCLEVNKREGGTCSIK